MSIYSLAADRDFGNTNRIHLPELTLVEEHVVAQARVLILIIKLAGYQHAERQAGKMGHAIVYSQYGKKHEKELMKAKRSTTTETYPQLENIYETFNIAFVGAQVDWASLKVNKNHRAFTPI